MHKRLRLILVSLLAALMLALMPLRRAYADAIANDTTVLVGLGALVLAAVVMVISLIGLLILIHYLRKDQRTNSSQGHGPIPPDER